MISPVFEKLSNDLSFAGVEFYKVDVDEQDQISQEVGVRAVCHIPCYFFILSLTLNIQMPTFALFKKGEKLSDVVGAHPQELQVCHLTESRLNVILICIFTQLLVEKALAD